MKRIQLLLIISILCASGLYAAPRPISFGVSAGIGLPKIPLSQFRSPISVLASGMTHVSFTEKWGIQVDGNALTTFSLGTVNKVDSDLQFDIYWGSVSLTYKLKGLMRNRSNLIAGIGNYYLTQQFNHGKEEIQTTGMNLGISSWMTHRRWRGYFEARWHLLFKPSENPQVLTVTYGWLL
ncbi:hypothetical protein HQ585_15355 [candidate division KSB1 bacterium]|nr:hypothetical protein [candidate division KSB1 bacterium]